ncbi:cobalamin trafficking protein CblD isoform X2 [Phymastichus coffea]|nr:cobalamin trafficking protein CblD isoform X2 [Phymastichus coffea]XP_058802468.1 cobalamin trafficking protein CblD isoform X2 [Phymastichus coffea]
MFCIRNIHKNYISSVRFISKAKYSRRSDKNTSSYKVVQSRDDALDDFDNHVFGVDPNWELLTPRGFRFYLPGSIGPGWLDASTTAHVEVRSVVVPNELEDLDFLKNKQRNINVEEKKDEIFSILHCTAQECPTLLRKGILELFPNCLEVTSPQLTIVTICQKSNSKMSRWSKEIETEKFAQYFVLAASDICKKLKMCGYWADFINPFSGQPYLNTHKNSVLYKTDERFRCVGFKVEQKKNCKIITSDNDTKQFIGKISTYIYSSFCSTFNYLILIFILGNLYTTAPSSTDFLKEIMNNMNHKLD